MSIAISVDSNIIILFEALTMEMTWRNWFIWDKLGNFKFLRIPNIPENFKSVCDCLFFLEWTNLFRGFILSNIPSFDFTSYILLLIFVSFLRVTVMQSGLCIFQFFDRMEFTCLSFTKNCWTTASTKHWKPCSDPIS